MSGIEQENRLAAKTNLRNGKADRRGNSLICAGEWFRPDDRRKTNRRHVVSSFERDMLLEQKLMATFAHLGNRKLRVLIARLSYRPTHQPLWDSPNCTQCMVLKRAKQELSDRDMQISKRTMP